MKIWFDMDGTIYLGQNLFDGVLETFQYLKEKDIDFVFFTNNSSHGLEFYHKKMTNFGVECDLDLNFYSSTEVTIDHLLKLGVRDIYVIGNLCLKEKLAQFFHIIPEYIPNHHIDAVIAGFSTELTYKELQDGCLYLQTNDCLFIATNGDWRCPIEDGLYIPDCGGMIEWIRLATNKKARVLGKPDSQVVYSLAKMFNIDLKDILLVGDRIYTDILVGVNAKVDTVMVLSGETTLKDLDNYSYRPTYIIDSIKDLPDLLNKI